MTDEITAGADLAPISDDRFLQLASRARELAKLGRLEHRTRWDVEAAAARAGVSPATLYRDLQKSRGNDLPTVRDLDGRRGGYPKNRSRLHPHVDAVIAEALTSHYLSANKPALTDTVKVIGSACESLGLPEPRRTAVRKRLLKIQRAQVEARRNGSKAKEAATPRTGAYAVEAPWDCWQIDHTLADVIVVDKHSRKPVGRPWLTVVIDVATRLIAGFYVSFEPPSTFRAGNALNQAVQPKDDWLKANRLTDYRWPIDGLPKLVHSDRATEFQSKAFERALANQNVDTFLRPPGKAHWGGHIERLIGTLMGKCKLLPGATQNSPKARGDYDSCQGARLDIEQLELWFAHQILGVYHNTWHAALGCTPLEAWDKMCAGLIPRRPSNPDGFRIDLLPETTRTLTRMGVKAFGEEYASTDIVVAFTQGQINARLKYDPRNLRVLYFEIEKGRWRPVPYRLPDLAGRYPTLWFYNYARKLAKLTGAPTEGIMARTARERAERELHGEALGSRVARKAVERMRHARVATGAPAPIIEDDSWGGAL